MAPRTALSQNNAEKRNIGYIDPQGAQPAGLIGCATQHLAQVFDQTIVSAKDRAKKPRKPLYFRRIVMNKVQRDVNDLGPYRTLSYLSRHGA